MKEQPFKISWSTIVLILAIFLAIKVTFWLIPVIIFCCLFFAGIYFLRKAGVIKQDESPIEAFKRFLNQQEGDGT